ncbi:MAG TPA: hypothetical protein VLE73_00705 [Candidatus Saccharimonadales bacterium]|nr:hypothetical protein [Candidatus Saccharimonadales bacterium]
MLLFHILTATISLIYTTITYLRPSSAKLGTSSALVVLTIASGTYLVATMHVHILQTCVSGLTYLAAVSFGLVAAYRKLAASKSD